jgi:hypothetical protein
MNQDKNNLRNRPLQGFRVRVHSERAFPTDATIIEILIDPIDQLVCHLFLIQRGLYSEPKHMPTLGWGMLPLLQWMTSTSTEAGRVIYKEMEGDGASREWFGAQRAILEIEKAFGR